MPVSKQSKRKQPETEDYESCSDSENEFKKSSSSNRNSKKKKLISESESESDSSVSEISDTEDMNNETSDEDKPIKEILEKSELNGNSEKMNVSSASSNDEALIAKTSSTCSGSINNSNSKSEPKENGVERCGDDDDDDDVPISKMVKTSNMNGKSKKMDISSSSSDDEPLVMKTSSSYSGAVNSSSIKSKCKENMIGTDDDDDDDTPISKMVKTPEMSEKSKKLNVLSDSSDDEPLVTKTSSKYSEDVNDSSIKSESKENEIETSDVDDIPISKVIQATERNGKSKKVKLSNDSSEDELLDIKSAVDSKKQKSECSSSSDDDKPLSNVPKTTSDRKLKQNKSLNSDSDDEPLIAKKSTYHKSKKQKNGHVSSDEDAPLTKLQKPSNAKNKQAKSSSNDRVEHLKKYLRLSGIHIQSYDKLFADCKSIKAKTEKLLSILHEKGMKGRPTIEKCKKLRKKLETKKEISELDMSNIIHTEGRPKRGSGGITQKVAKVENSPAEERFSRLKDIIDSEESD